MASKVSKISSKRRSSATSSPMAAPAAKPSVPSDTKEDIVTSEEINPNLKGAKLLAWLLAEARHRNIKFRELSDHLGISRSYLFSLRYGQRQIETLSLEILQQCATFLRVPMISVMMAAETIRPEYFFDTDNETFKSQINRAIDYMSGDSNWGAWMPDMRSYSWDAKLFTVLLYEKATGRNLIESKIDMHRVIQQFRGEKE